MNRVDVYKIGDWGRIHIGYIENNKIYLDSNSLFSDNCVGECYYYGIYKKDRFFGEKIAMYDDKYFYKETLCGKERIAFIENGKIYKCVDKLHPIGEYEGFSDASCISLLLCNFGFEEKIYDNNSDYDSPPYKYPKSQKNYSSNDFSVVETITIIIGLIIVLLLFIFIIYLSLPILWEIFERVCIAIFFVMLVLALLGG